MGRHLRWEGGFWRGFGRFKLDKMVGLVELVFILDDSPFSIVLFWLCSWETRLLSFKLGEPSNLSIR